MQPLVTRAYLVRFLDADGNQCGDWGEYEFESAARRCMETLEQEQYGAAVAIEVVCGEQRGDEFEEWTIASRSLT